MISYASQRRLDALRRQMDRLDGRLQRLERLSRKLSRLRTALVLGGICAALAAERFLGSSIAWLTLGLSGAAFVAAAFGHRRVRHSCVRHAVWKHIKSTHVARLTHDWASIPQPPDIPNDPETPVRRRPQPDRPAFRTPPPRHQHVVWRLRTVAHLALEAVDHCRCGARAAADHPRAGAAGAFP